jgi:hypothetical protein
MIDIIIMNMVTVMITRAGLTSHGRGRAPVVLGKLRKKDLRTANINTVTTRPRPASGTD